MKPKMINGYDHEKVAAKIAAEYDLSPDESGFILYLLENLPPIIARKSVESFFGGLISAKTLSNADSAGFGPEAAFKIGPNVAYRTDFLLRWLVERSGISQLISIKTL